MRDFGSEGSVIEADSLAYRKFFGKANGTTASIPQQSKLSFATKPKAEPKDVETKEEPKSSPEESSKEEDTETAVGPDVKEEVNGDAMEVDSTPPSEAGKKRQVEEEEEDSDDAPPTKRQRKKPTKAEPSSAKKPKAAPKKSEKPAPEPKKSPVKPPKKAKVVEPSEEDEETPAPVKVPKGKQKDVEGSPAQEEDAVSSANEEEEEALNSDEEPPEVKVKARKKVQSTLSSTTKDPFPDWKPGEPVPYAALCTTFSKIEMTTKRLEISAHCSLFLRQVLRLTPDDLLPVILLMINKLAADYAGIELGIGESLIMKAISESTGRTLQHIKTDQNEIGDLGLVAAHSRSKQPTMFKPKSLTVQGVRKGLMAIATTEGQGAQGRKVDGIKKLLSAADAHTAGKAVDITKDKGGASEAKYIVRTLEGKLRLGLAEKTVLVALAHAMIYHEVSQNGSKIPSTTDLAKAESTLKSVYRYVKYPRPSLLASIDKI